MAAWNLAVVGCVAVRLEAVEDSEDLILLVEREAIVLADGWENTKATEGRSGRRHTKVTSSRAVDVPMISKLMTDMNCFSREVEASLIWLNLNPCVFFCVGPSN